MERYLLGQGSEEERARFAEELLADTELHAQLQEFETEQVDALARGLLKGEQAAAWRQFLSDTGQLDRLGGRPGSRRKSPLPTATARMAPSGSGTASHGAAAWWWTTRPAPPAPLVASVRISLDLPRHTTRGTNQDLERNLPKEATEVEWRFEVAPEPATGYRLTIRDRAGSTLWTQEGKGWPNPILSIVTPATAIPQATLELELSALDASGTASPVSFHRVRIHR